MRLRARHTVLALIILILVAGCGQSPTDTSDADSAASSETAATTFDPVPAPETSGSERVDDDLDSTSPETDIGAAPVSIKETVGPDGGDIVVDDPESPLDDMRLEVPAGAYAAETEFAVSHRPFEGELPDGVSALTPIVEVENGGDYADEIMTITIPIELPEDHFAMGFFVHENGTLEGMPLVELTQDSITVATMHFSDFFIAVIADTLLEAPIETGFKPGTDDWQFPNRGSAIARGHCAGQSVSAMWYYYEKHLQGAPQLYGQYDNNSGPKTPDLWQDDSNGYRLASTIQKDIDFRNLLRKTFNALAGMSDLVTWKAFLFSMHVTREPQYVEIWDTDTGKGHAMIAYAVNPEMGHLRIADPNYPGDEERLILYQDGTLWPYESGDNILDILLGLTKNYERICYGAKSALLPWSTATHRWSEFENGTIGDDRFPIAELHVRTADGKRLLLTDGLKTNAESLDVVMAPSGLTYSVWRDGSWLPFDAQGNFSLLPGENLLGFYIKSVEGDGKYVDFQWIRVERTMDAVQIEIDVQVHAQIRRTNQPDQAAGYAGQILEHDTPFEMITLTGYGGATMTGRYFTAAWKDVPDPSGEGHHLGVITLRMNEEGTQISQFEAGDVLTLPDGSIRKSLTSGGTIPSVESTDGSRQFVIRGKEVCDSLDGFLNSWEFEGGDTREVIGFTCDENSLIRITVR
ncbi:hypothetical protein ACFLSG_03630 [Candidatus Bipolaricaulota bacterium]